VISPPPIWNTRVETEIHNDSPGENAVPHLPGEPSIQDHAETTEGDEDREP